MKRIFVSILFFFCAIYSSLAADNSRSDTIDITDYYIHLNITDYTGHTIKGFTIVSFKSKLNNISELDLDLLKLHIDSISQNNQLLTFTYNDTLIKINLLSAMNTGDSSQIIVFYHGSPQGDASGWGGWYWTGVYSYNLGVGFAADPHCYGRIWFPCFDNFVERSTYHFSIITTDDKIVTSNGRLISSFDNGDSTKTWNWEMLQRIPSYLACVAVAPYTPAYFKYISITGDTIPIMLAALPADTTKMKNSFQHLQNALSIFENHFGKFQWNKVGYSLVPFNSGSMEHATNIASPYFASDGTIAYETLFFHELSHHWFGDLVTCRTEEDMWLNEGWAVYSEKIFLEGLYGEQAYKDDVAANHETSVHYAHTPLKDGKYYALNAVPHDHSYTSEGTVYDKGADIAHTLRGYMGDSLFFHCITNYLSDKAFTDEASENFRDYLSNCSGIDLSDFFNDWVFAPGWSSFTIDSVSTNPGQLPGYLDVQIFIHQRLDHTTHYYNNIPLEVFFYDSDWNVTKQTFIVSGSCYVTTMSLPFAPVFVGLDLDEKISDAVTADLKTIKSLGATTCVNGKMTVTTTSIADSALLRIEHVYAPPDPLKNPIPNLHISQERFWKVDGIFPADFEASASVSYNGLPSTGGFLDNQLLTNVEDSLVMLYRSSLAADWKIDTDVFVNFLGLNNDKRGIITINHLQKGEYALAIFQHTKVDSVVISGVDSCLLLSDPLISSAKGMIRVFPNPANNSFIVAFDHPSQNYLLEIFNLYGAPAYHHKFNEARQEVSVKNWTRGIYLVKISDAKHRTIAMQKIVIN